MPINSFKMFNAGFFIWKLLVKSWNRIYFDVKRVFHKAVLQLFCDVTIYKDFMKYQRNPQTNLQTRIIKKKSLRGRKDFQCRYVYQYLIILQSTSRSLIATLGWCLGNVIRCGPLKSWLADIM